MIKNITGVEWKASQSNDSRSKHVTEFDFEFESDGFPCVSGNPTDLLTDFGRI